MNYKVLYRKYRPNNFENIIGQDYVITTLKNAIKTGNISHAYIFSGPRGTGKTSTAKVFAKAINCLNPVEGSPCGTCDFCQNFQDNPDIIEIDAASNNGVDEIRQIIDNIKITPTNGKYKVYIIDEVHMLSTSAFNALLLTLEEPPAHAIFILATTNIENVPITILSRCQRYDFQKIKVQDMVKRLTEIANIEHIAIDDEALEEIAYLSEGGLRDALSLLDQLSKVDEQITLELVERQVRTISKCTIQELLQYIETNDLEKCLNLINDFRIRAVDYKSLVKKIIEAISEKIKKNLYDNSFKRIDTDRYKKLIFELVDSINKVNINVDSYTILEMILYDYFEPLKDVQATSKQAQETKVDNAKPMINDKKEELKKESVLVTNEEIESLRKIRVNNCLSEAQKTDLIDIKEKLSKLLDDLSFRNGQVKMVLVDSMVVAASKRNLLFTSNSEHNVSQANKMLKEIEESLNEALQGSFKIFFLTNEEWNQEKAKYVEALKENKKYEYIEEKEEVNEKETIISDVFDINKVEII